jgi:hypothetical protein
MKIRIMFGFQSARFVYIFLFLQHLPTPRFVTQACLMLDKELYRFWHPCEQIRETACSLQGLRKAILIKAVCQVCVEGLTQDRKFSRDVPVTTQPLDWFVRTLPRGSTAGLRYRPYPSLCVLLRLHVSSWSCLLPGSGSHPPCPH